MNISAIKGYSNALNTLNFKGKDQNQTSNDPYYNPVSVKKERALAILSSAGMSAVAGVVGLGIGHMIKSTLSDAKSSGVRNFPYTPVIGAIIALGTLALTLPSRLYHTKVNATVKSKEMDVFTRDRELKKDLTENVHGEVKDPEVSLDKKLNDNLKLQLANKGAGLGIATI